MLRQMRRLSLQRPKHFHIQIHIKTTRLGSAFYLIDANI